jgi:hypothetical protein
VLPAPVSKRKTTTYMATNEQGAGAWRASMVVSLSAPATDLLLSSPLIVTLTPW